MSFSCTIRYRSTGGGGRAVELTRRRFWMTVRIILGASWALVVGLAGGWLMLSPWALAEQASGRDWTSVTQAQFFTGLGLVVLAVAGLGLVAMQALQGLRQ